MVPGRVLLVDDDPSILRMLKLVLQRSGFITDEARDGKGAMALLSEQDFNVVISDVNMPGGGGMEFVRSVREKNLGLPVIMITGKPTVESTTRALEFGVFRYLLKPVSPKALMDAVDRALQECQVKAGSQAALHEEETKLLGPPETLESRFQAALEGMWMAYQPIVEPRTGATYGYEALLRSDEPSLATPAALLCAAKKLRRMTQLGRSVRARLASAPLPEGSALFVNLDASDLLDDELYAAHAPLSLHAFRVVLELTERVGYDHIPDLDQRIARLRRLGFRIAIDDLSCGQVSTTFSRLNPDFAKLDPKLVRDVHGEPHKQAVVRAVCGVCADLGIRVIAEAVESAQEAETLSALGCHLMQGYLYGRPGRAMRG